MTRSSIARPAVEHPDLDGRPELRRLVRAEVCRRLERYSPSKRVEATVASSASGVSISSRPCARVLALERFVDAMDRVLVVDGHGARLEPAAAVVQRHVGTLEGLPVPDPSGARTDRTKTWPLSTTTQMTVARIISAR